MKTQTDKTTTLEIPGFPPIPVETDKNNKDENLLVMTVREQIKQTEMEDLKHLLENHPTSKKEVDTQDLWNEKCPYGNQECPQCNGSDKKNIPTQTDWKTRFDDRWYGFDKHAIYGKDGKTMVVDKNGSPFEAMKNFIQSELTQQRNELINAFEEMVYLTEEEAKIGIESGKMRDLIAGNQLRLRILSKLAEMRKE